MELITFRDIIDDLIDFSGAGQNDADQRRYRRAVREAYKDLSMTREWRFYLQHHRIFLEAPYTTGTIAYTHSTRTVALTSGTWPDWAASGKLIIGDVVSEVDSRDGDTTLTLDTTINPGDDVASGTSYTLYRSIYILPSDFLSMDFPSLEDSWMEESYIEPREFLARERTERTSGTPFMWTVMGSRKYYGAMAVHVTPYPASAETMDFYYRRQPRPLVYSGYNSAESAGTISNSAATAAVVGVGSSFEAAMEGSVLRFGTTSNKPDGSDGLNAYADQKIILDVTDTTNLTTDSTISAAHSGVKYVISDPIDVAPYMLEAFRQNCRRHLAQYRRSENLPAIEGHYQSALAKALDADSPVSIPRNCYGRVPARRRLADMPLGEDI